jgi:hypothetical protein
LIILIDICVFTVFSYRFTPGGPKCFKYIISVETFLLFYKSYTLQIDVRELPGKKIAETESVVEQPGKKIAETESVLEQPGKKISETESELPGKKIAETEFVLEPGKKIAKTGSEIEPGEKIAEPESIGQEKKLGQFFFFLKECL